MFLSTYLPLKVASKTEAAVHTSENIYPYELLQEAHDSLTGKPSNNVIVNNGNISFVSNPEIRWFLCDIVNAYERFQIAKESKFAFFPVYNMKGTISLYVSSVFKCSRLLVDAYTMQTVLVTKAALIKRLSTIIDKRVESSYAMNLFQYARALEAGYKNYLDAWISNAGTDDELVCMNPLTCLYVENSEWYFWDELTEIEQIVTGATVETERYILQSNTLRRKDLEHETPISVEWGKHVVTTWHKLHERQRSYLPINDIEEKYPLCYCSTDLHHFVDAATGEHVTVKNKSFRETLKQCVTDEYIDRNAYNVLWQVLRLREET